MSENKDIKKELEDLSPMLSKMREQKENPFQVPPNYFQSMQNEVFRQIASEQKTPEQVTAPNWVDQLIGQLQWLLQPRYAMALATVAVLLIAGIFYLQPTANLPSTEVALNDLTEDDITTYISSHIEDFDATLLVEAIPEEEDASLLPTPELEDEEIEEYLQDIIDDIDLEELEELL